MGHFEKGRTVREWRDTADKVQWGEGPWQREPDKMQWVDEASDLDCLIVRNRIGALCGYVGVPETHPLFGVDYYSAETDALAEARERRLERPVGDTFPALLAALSGEVNASPELVFEVHGGLTFSDFCREPEDVSREGWAASGDGRTFEEWLHEQYGGRICHVPDEGRPTRVWWFGFDCAHHSDLCPGMRQYGARSWDRSDVYRTTEYVQRECASLARQLAGMERPEGAVPT